MEILNEDIYQEIIKHLPIYLKLSLVSKSIKNIVDLIPTMIDVRKIYNDDTLIKIYGVLSNRFVNCNFGIKVMDNTTQIFQGVVTGKGFGACPRITSLIIGGKFVTNEALVSNKNLTRLFLLGNHKITDDGISKMTKLTGLCIYNNGNLFAHKITDNGIKSLTNLTILNIHGDIVITDTGLKNITGLTSLNINNTRRVTDKFVNTLNHLKILNIANNTNITDNGISNLTTLTELNLSNNPKITDKGIIPLINITDLNLWSNNCITYDGIKNLSKLIKLDIRYNIKITNEDIEKLTSLKKLIL